MNEKDLSTATELLKSTHAAAIVRSTCEYLWEDRPANEVEQIVEAVLGAPVVVARILATGQVESTTLDAKHAKLVEVADKLRAERARAEAAEDRAQKAEADAQGREAQREAWQARAEEKHREWLLAIERAEKAEAERDEARATVAGLVEAVRKYDDAREAYDRDSAGLLDTEVRFEAAEDAKRSALSGAALVAGRYRAEVEAEALEAAAKTLEGLTRANVTEIVPFLRDRAREARRRGAQADIAATDEPRKDP